MTLKPVNKRHALQIQAGTLGRIAGHKFEDTLTDCLNSLPMPYCFNTLPNKSRHVFTGDVEVSVLNYICSHLNITTVEKVVAISTGALATSQAGIKWLNINGVKVSKCKSDIILIIKPALSDEVTIGISTKQCNNKTPTNAQLYFTTAKGFCNLLRNNGICVSADAEKALKQFCGDVGFRPSDFPSLLAGRQTDPRRFFWEEIVANGKLELETTLSTRQDEITRLLLQKAYLNDPFAPDIVLHKTKKADSWDSTEVAIYTVDELISLSKSYAGFSLRPYSVRKGSYRDPEGVSHLAPRFGIVQMQRGGQIKHPTQLQFNLEAGYFYKI